MKRLVAVTMAVMMSFTTVVTGSVAFGKDANDGYYGIISGQYTCYYYGENNIRTYYYSDDYFREAGSAKNEHLRTMSAALANAEVDEEGDAYTEEILENTGFTDIVNYGTGENDVQDVVFGHKKIDDTELVVAVFGTSNGLKEWTSDFKVGDTDDSQGFAEGTEAVVNYYNEYINKYSLKPGKIWATGYSRGGAIADLFGKYLNQNTESTGVSEDNIYVYTIEAPLTTTEDVSYDNIHNVVDENDIVTYVVPAKWGYSNCGVKEIINKKNTKIKKKKISTQKLMAGKDPVENDGVTTIPVFLNDFFSWLCDDEYLSRETYVKYLQDDLGPLTYMLLSKSTEENEAIKDYFANDFMNAFSTSYRKYMIAGIFVSIINGDTDSVNKAKTKAKNLLKEVLDEDEAKEVFTADDITTINKVAADVLDSLIYALRDDYNGSNSGGNKTQNIIIFGASDDTLYKSIVSSYGNDIEDNALKDSASTDKEKKEWYEGYDEGYDAGYEAGEKEADYDSSSYKAASDKEYTESYISGYKYGYCEAYLSAMAYEDINHTFTRITTFAANIETLINPHYPGSNIILVENQDSYYTNAPEIGTTENKTQVTAGQEGSAFTGGYAAILIGAGFIAGGVGSAFATKSVRKKREED